MDMGYDLDQGVQICCQIIVFDSNIKKNASVK